jgi:HSP20 family molecular chaperone IbpA
LEAIEQESWRKGLLVMSGDDVKKSFRTPIVIGLVMLVLGLVVGVGAGRFMGRGSLLAQKGEPAKSAAGPSASGKMQGQAPDPFFSDPTDPWDPFREMRSLQAEMNEMFRQSIARFHASPSMNPFGDDAGYSLSLDVRDLKDRYEVKAFLPDAKASEANVKLEGNRLEVSVTHRQPGNAGNTNAPSVGTEWGRYTQVVELAGNLKSEKMKVQQKDHDLVITIPKA